jgi:glucosyl-3-phosphoglycerate synthase
MFNVSQKHTRITTFYLLSRETEDLASKLKLSARRKKTVLVIPALATEFTQEENRPVFLNILKQIGRLTYLSNIIFGLDRATEAEALELASLCRHHGIRNAVIQHNDGEDFRRLYDSLNDAGFEVTLPGKGRNMFMSFGVAQALGARCVGVLDADIRTFHRRQLDRLFYPILALDYQFSKAFYARIGDNRMYGRVKRLLVDPLLLAFKRKFSESGDDKFLRLIDYLLMFNYQLSGEVAFDMSLLKRMHFAMNWGVEIFTLIEVYRKATNIAQIQFSSQPFDHKHQGVSMENKEKGLHKMAIDIVTTILSALVIEEGLEISDYFMQDLTLTYLNVADELIKKYADNSSFSALQYDRNSEEAIVRKIFKDAVLTAGDYLTTPQRSTERFLRILSSHERFRKYLEAGITEDLMAYEMENRSQLFETPQTVSWERIIMKLPRILYDIADVVERQRSIYGKA